MKVFQAIKNDEALTARGRMMITFGDDDELRGLVAESLGLYSHVANVDAGSKEEVFKIMNRWDDEDRERVRMVTGQDRISSLSVGDIVVDNDGEHFIVATFGFINVFANKEAA